MLAVLSLAQSKILVEKHAPSIEVPWLFVKGSIFDFLGLLRTRNFFMAEATNRETANALQEVLFVEGKPVLLPLPVGLAVLLPLNQGQQALDRIGAESVLGWANAREIVRRFLEHLYAHSIFILEVRDGAEQLVQDKTEKNNLYLRIKQPAAQAQGEEKKS
jgi:hypothetical protein